MEPRYWMVSRWVCGILAALDGSVVWGAAADCVALGASMPSALNTSEWLGVLSVVIWVVMRRWH